MIASMIWSPIVNTGFSEVIGSWKIIAMSLPRIARICSSDAAVRSTSWPALFWNRILPVVMRPLL